MIAGGVILYLFFDLFHMLGATLWWLGGLGFSFLAFGLVLPFDREYTHGLAAHHGPEIGVVFFAGSALGAYFHHWTTFVLVGPVFLLFYEIIYIAVKMNKKQATWKELAEFTLFFTGVVAVGIASGVAFPGY